MNYISIFDYVNTIIHQISNDWDEPVTFNKVVVNPELHYKLRIYVAGRKVGTMHIKLYNVHKNVFNISFKDHFYYVTADKGEIGDSERSIFNKRLVYFVKMDLQNAIDKLKNPVSDLVTC